MPKGSKINKKTPKPGKKAGVKTDRIKKRAESAVDKEPVMVGPVTKQEPNITIYGQDHKVKNKISRGLYTDDILPKLEELAAAGLTNAQIAESLCIGNKTFYDWRSKYPQFLHALNKYRGVADIFVENAFYLTATGYEYTEELCTPTGKVVPVRKWKAGDSRAQIHYLNNRMKHRYSNKVETIHSMGAGMETMAFALKRREE